MGFIGIAFGESMGAAALRMALPGSFAAVCDERAARRRMELLL
jgi:hypothetical protein